MSDYNRKTISSVLDLIADLLVRAITCYGVYNKLWSIEPLRERLNDTKPANVYELILDSLFRNVVLTISSLFDGLTMPQDPFCCPHCKQDIERKPHKHKSATFAYLFEYIKKHKEDLAKETKLTMETFNRIYEEFERALLEIQQSKNEDWKKLKKIRDRLIAHSGIKKKAETGTYSSALPETDITYQQVENFLFYCGEIVDKASLLIDSPEGEWRGLKSEAELLTNQFLKMISSDPLELF